jgi:hypothetical protein
MILHSESRNGPGQGVQQSTGTPVPKELLALMNSQKR